MRGFTGVSGVTVWGVGRRRDCGKGRRKKVKKFLRAIGGARNMYFRRFTHG